MATPTTHRPYKRERQMGLPKKGPDPLPRGTAPNAPEKTAAWPGSPGPVGNSKSRMRGIARVKTRMMENIG